MDADAPDAVPGSAAGEPDPWSTTIRVVPSGSASSLTTAPAPDPEQAAGLGTPGEPQAPLGLAAPGEPQAPLGLAAPGDGAGTTDSEAAMLASARRRRHVRWVVEWALVLVVAFAVALGVRAFVVQTYFIPSASMEPTLMIGDRILVDKLSYHLHPVHRGDIVVFGRPPGEQSALGIQDLVKRVVGLPGETIWSTDGQVYVEGPDTGGKAIDIPEPVRGTELGPPIRRTTIPANDYFVMGDNRTNSDDSRYFGPISRSLIVGRVVMRIWPLSHLGTF